MKNTFYIVLITILTFTINAKAQEINLNQIEAKIDALIPSRVNDSTPGLVVGVVKEGKLIFNKSYGLGNLAYQIPNDSKMVYNLGSATKQFLGYAFAMLHAQGKLDLDDTVNKYLEDWPTFDHPVTLRHLLTHTSGYREAYTMSELAGRVIDVDRLTQDECLEVIRKQPKLEFTPGTRHTYNSTSYVVLSQILQKVTQMPADQWVEAHIFEPLNMKSSQIESYVGEMIPNAAESYAFNSKTGYTNIKSNRAIFGGADIYSSVEDLAKWFTIFSSDVLGDNEVKRAFVEPYILADGTNTEYALGIRTEMHKGLKVYHHTGGHENFISQLRYYPDADLGIIVMTNFGRNGWLSASRVAELFLSEKMTEEPMKELKAIELKQDKLQQLEGLYIAETFNGTLDLSVEDGSLTLNGRNILVPLSEKNFGINGWNGSIEIEKTSESIKLYLIDGQKETYIKVEKWKVNVEQLKNYEGKYFSNELEVIYNLYIQKDHLVVKNRWFGTMKLQPISKDFFESDRGYYVKFTRNDQGEINGCNINSERTLNVYCNRMNQL